tara:strand:+ start:78133 stop:79323 length:1191 start_codon:yes stop_codon:yes gene_type:complete
MGFINNTGNIELKAKLTPEGRRKLITNTNVLISSFSLGDSDSYYDVFSGLTDNQIPEISGDNEGRDTNNGGYNYIIKSTINYKPTIQKKPVEIQSINVNSEVINLGYSTEYFSGGTITQNLINLNNKSTDRLVNLFYSFGLPLSDSDYSRYTGTTSTNGGFSDTALSGLAQNNILVIGISGSTYAEIIDGKTIRATISSSGTTYTLFSTFENKGLSLPNEDINVLDVSTNITQFGPNISLLFSDDIQKPNTDATKSWGTGYGQNKPYSVNGKELYNFRPNTNTGIITDKAVGISYLDKGFLVITEPTIVNAFTGDTGTTITFDTIRNRVSQSFTCIANRGEFAISTNPTWQSGDVPRISEIGLWDNTNTLIAVGKLNESYYKPTDDFVAFNITIDY